MRELTDQRYLRQEQYHDGANLSARMRLHTRFSTNPDGWHRWVFDHLGLAPGSCAIEVGCGSGTLWWENRARIPRCRQILLTDVSPGMLEGARRRLQGLEVSLQFAVVDAQALPLGDASVDVVIANHMLYHLPDLSGALAEIRRVLKPGGHLCATTNGRDHLRELGGLGQSIEANLLAESIGFTLENGAGELGAVFADVTLHTHHDYLWVTEAEAILDYIRSEPAGARLDEAAISQLRSTVEDEIAHRGGFRMTKASGMFIARRCRT